MARVKTTTKEDVNHANQDLLSRVKEESSATTMRVIAALLTALATGRLTVKISVSTITNAVVSVAAVVKAMNEMAAIAMAASVPLLTVTTTTVKTAAPLPSHLVLSANPIVSATHVASLSVVRH